MRGRNFILTSLLPPSSSPSSLFLSFFILFTLFIFSFILKISNVHVHIISSYLFLPLSLTHTHRLDSTIGDFTEMQWSRGDISFIYNGETAEGLSVVALDNKKKLYQRLSLNNNNVRKRKIPPSLPPSIKSLPIISVYVHVLIFECVYMYI